MKMRCWSLPALVGSLKRDEFSDGNIMLGCKEMFGLGVFSFCGTTVSVS